MVKYGDLMNALIVFIILGDYRPLLAIARQPPGTAYVVPIRIASQSVLASLAHHSSKRIVIAELRFLTKLNLVFA